ncbi:MAG: nucleoside hydrolase, partial [Candidatus Helarchaeales archaeon]
MNLLIDTDPGLGAKGFVDVDDGLAIFMALGSEEIEVPGITVTHGNTPVDVGFSLLQEYLRVARKTDIPHFKGASSRKDLGKHTPATDFLIKMVKEHPKDINLLTLGPLTNIASALLIRPEFLDDLKNIVIMGSCINPPFGLKFLAGEFNVGKDPVAVHRILKSSKTKIIVGMDVCMKVRFTRQQARQIRSSNSRVARYISHNMNFWYQSWRLVGGFVPWDPIALA